jgi:hypothetical protein
LFRLAVCGLPLAVGGYEWSALWMTRKEYVFYSSWQLAQSIAGAVHSDAQQISCQQQTANR